MDRTELIRSLRRTLGEIAQSGGNGRLHLQPDYAMLDMLRGEFYEVAADLEIQSDFDRRPRLDFLDDILQRDRFARRISYCTIVLNDCGVPGQEHLTYLRQVLKELIGRIDSPPYSETKKPPRSVKIRDLIEEKVASCFEPWYYPSDVLAYEILEEHMLCSWEYLSKKWRLTNLGRYASQLNAFSLLLLLLSIEIGFTREWSPRRYPNRKILRSIVTCESDDPGDAVGRRLPIALRWYGITDRRRYGKTEVTEFGRRLITRVLKTEQEMRDLVWLFVESEEQGYYLPLSDPLLEQFEKSAKQAKILNEEQRGSIQNLIALYRSGNYLDALRLFYPSIENFVDMALVRLGHEQKKYNGLAAKLQALSTNDRISFDLSCWGEIVCSRNKIVHGNLHRNESDLLRPLFLVVANFWQRLVEELST